MIRLQPTQLSEFPAVADADEAVITIWTLLLVPLLISAIKRLSDDVRSDRRSQQELVNTGRVRVEKVNIPWT